MKMANMDHVFDYMFTNPKDSQGVSSSNFQTAVLSQRMWKVGRKENLKDTSWKNRSLKDSSEQCSL